MLFPLDIFIECVLGRWMNAMMLYCIICEKTTKINSKSKHIHSNSHEDKRRYSFATKEYEFIGLDNNKIDFVFGNRARDCYIKYFHTFKLRCIYNIEMLNGNYVNGIFSGKNLKKIVRENGFIQKIETTIYSNSSNLSICKCLKFRLLMMHRQFFRILSHNSEHVQNYCNDRKNPFQFACREWMLENNT